MVGAGLTHLSIAVDDMAAAQAWWWNEAGPSWPTRVAASRAWCATRGQLLELIASAAARPLFRSFGALSFAERTKTRRNHFVDQLGALVQEAPAWPA